MLRTSVALAREGSPEEAGASVGAQIAAALEGTPPDAVIVFASPTYARPEMARALKAASAAKLVVGCSSAGEFTGAAAAAAENAVCAVALASPEMRFTASLATGVSRNPAGAARELVGTFSGVRSHEYRYHTALLLADALAGHTDELLEQLTLLTMGTYQFFGGGAGDNAQFAYTPVLFDTNVVADGAVALEILSQTPIGIGVQHGWEPATPGMRVTEADGMRLVSLNAAPALDVFQEHAQRTEQRFDPEHPIPFFLHNILGIATEGGYKLRVPLAVHADGSIQCAADLPSGAIVHIMRTSSRSAEAAAEHAARAALAQLGDHEPQLAIFFDCVATRLRMGQEFGMELRALQAALGNAQHAGCNTHGQVARAEGQFSGFHNCTAVVCVFPR